MGFKKPVVPATSKPSTCAARINDRGDKCGKAAHNTISFQAEVMGKLINVKKMVCDDHSPKEEA